MLRLCLSTAKSSHVRALHLRRNQSRRHSCFVCTLSTRLIARAALNWVSGDLGTAAPVITQPGIVAGGQNNDGVTGFNPFSNKNSKCGVEGKTVIVHLSGGTRAACGILTAAHTSRRSRHYPRDHHHEACRSSSSPRPTSLNRARPYPFPRVELSPEHSRSSPDKHTHVTPTTTAPPRSPRAPAARPRGSATAPSRARPRSRAA